jgi:quinoprotein glucose dehydrogenase
LIPDRPRTGRGGPQIPQITAERQGRAVYEQNCQMCHGPDLKGDRGPQIDNAASRLGGDSLRTVITKGRGAMPPIAVEAAMLDNLMAFLTRPEAAPPGSAAPAAMLGMGRAEPPYPEGVTPPPSRYKTGYGNEPYVITPPWSQITAYDLNTGKIKWQTPYGDLPQAGPSGKLRGNVYPKSGFVITAGGLVLFAGNDSKLYALDKDTGKLLATKDLQNGSLGVPAVYEANGRQYVLLAVSGGNPFPAAGRLAPGGVNPPSTSHSYVAFALAEEKK